MIIIGRGCARLLAVLEHGLVEGAAVGALASQDEGHGGGGRGRGVELFQEL